MIHLIVSFVNEEWIINNLKTQDNCEKTGSTILIGDGIKVLETINKEINVGVLL